METIGIKRIKNSKFKVKAWLLNICCKANLFNLEQKSGTRNGIRQQLHKKILQYDTYGEPIRFNYANGNAVYSTGLGACLSVLVTLLTYTYFGNNLHVMFKHKGDKVSISFVDSAFTYNDTVTQDDGFRLAIGLDPRFGAKLNISDYLELRVSFYTNDFSGEKVKENFSEIQLQTCTDQDLSHFYQIKNSDKGQFSKLKASLMCFDHS